MMQAIPAPPPPQFWLQDEFDALASGIIYYCNLPVILTAGIVIVIFYAAAWARGKTDRPLAGPVLRLLLAAAGVWSGLFTIAALTFSAKPRLDALDLKEWKILGVVASFVLLGVSAYEYFTSFRDIRK